MESDEELEGALDLMEAMGDRVLSIDIAELTPERLMKDVAGLLETDPDALAILEEKKSELGDGFDRCKSELAGTMHFDVMKSNGWKL